ncbi:transposase [Azospirillum aestuarii]|uniref:transposase n=1 Tax=Azospirillum aestuarii TaxID=2802052 RepID=UPI004054AC35
MLGSLLELLGLELLGLDLPVPDHTTLSRRSATLTPILRAALPDGPVHLVLDSTGLKVFGAGEWLTDKHGARQPRRWRKLHLCVDAASSTIVGAVLTTTEAGDASQVGPALEQTTGPITTVLANGAYDGEPIYQTIAQHDPGAVVIIPPCATSVPSNQAEPPPDAARPPHPADRRNRPDGMAARNQVRPPLQRGNGHGALQGHSWRVPPRPNSARSAGGSHDRRIRPQPHARRRTPRAGAHRVTGGRMDEQIGRPSPCTNTLLTDIVEKVGC